MSELGFRRVPRAVGRFWERLSSLVHRPANPSMMLGLLGTCAAALILLALLLRLLDPFEDGYQHWWIAANLAETGQYWDRHSMMTQGNWLPFYDFFAAAWLLLFGLHNIGILKLVNLGLVVGTVLLTYRIGAAEGSKVGLLAAAFLALNPVTIVVGTWTTPDTLAVFAGYAAYLLLFISTADRRMRLAGASLALLVGVATRYELWAFFALLLVFLSAHGLRDYTRQELALVLAPSFLFMAFYALWTLRYGFLPEIILAQTSTDLRYQLSAGTQPSVLTVLGRYWGSFVGFYPFVFLVGGAMALLRARREYIPWLIFAFWGAIIAYTALRFGNPSYRYPLITLPALSLYAAQGTVKGLSRLSRSLKSKTLRPKLRSAIVVAVAATVALGAFVPMLQVSEGLLAEQDRPMGYYMEPMRRAGLWLSTVAIPEGRLIISESPIAAYHSGLPPSSLLGSRWLPQDRAAAEAFLLAEVAYVLYMGVPYYPLRTMFPELQAGNSTGIFELVYDASGPELAQGAHAVFVYRIVA